MGKEKKVQIKDKIKKMAIKQGMKMVLVAIKHIIISIISALLPYIGTILLAVTLITGFAYILEIFTAEDTSAAVRTAIGTENIADSIEIKSFDGGGYYISMPQDISKRLEKALKKAKVEYADLGIKNTSTIEKFIKAEIVTQYPDLGADLGQDNSSEKLQGAIKIKRATVDKSVGELKESDKKEEMLTYVDKTIFDEYIANNNIEAIKHFTLDESGNLIIASWSYTKKTKTENENIVEENTEYTIKQNSPINYKAQVEKYTMPFEYPLAFLIDGQDVEFAEKLADLALNSEIVITVQDNITTTENIISEKTTVTTEEKNVYSYKKSDGSEEYNKETERKKIAEDITTIETKTITESNTPNIEITSVDSWCTKFTKEYSYITSDTGLTSGEPENADPTTVTKFNSIDINGNYMNNITDNNGNHMQNTENNTSIEDNEKELENGDKLQRKENIQYITTAKSTTTSNRVITNKYNSGLSKTEGNEQKFVDAFRSSKQAKGNIMNEPEWLFDILENSDKTANMLDLTKYLLYKATGKDLGVTEFDFSIYDAASFSGATGGGSISLSETQFTKEVFKEALQAYYDKTRNQSFYNNFLVHADELYDESVKNSINPELVVVTANTEGGFTEQGGSYNYWGIAVYNGQSSGSGFATFADGIKGFANVMHSYDTGEYADQIKKMYDERKAAGVDVLGYGMPGTLSGWQSLYSFLGKHGDAYSSSGSGGYYYMDPDIAGVTTIYKTHQEFLEKCKNSGLPEHADGTTTTVWEQGQFTAYQVEEKINAWKRIFGDYGTLTQGGEFLEKADEIHKYMEQNNYNYCLLGGESNSHAGEHGLNNTFEESKTGHHLTCCATYVSWVLYECGYTECAGIHNCTDLAAVLASKTQRITSYDDLEAGDIVFWPNGKHVQIYAGDGMWYNAGGTSSVQGSSPYKSDARSNFSFALRLNK